MGDDSVSSSQFCVMSVDGESVGYVSEDGVTVSSGGDPIAVFRDSFSDSITLELKQADFSAIDRIIKKGRVTALTFAAKRPLTRSEALMAYARERGGKFWRNYKKALRRSLRNSGAEPTAWCP